MSNKKVSVKEIVDYVLLAICFTSTLVFGIILKQDVIKLLPALFSTIIFLMSAKAYRISYLFGAINSGLYSVGYFMMGLYGNFIVNLVLYIPIQIVTFAMWSKNKYKQSTVFRRLPLKYEILLFVGVLIAWGVGCLVISSLPNANLPLVGFDSAGTVVGTITAVMTMLALIETVGYDCILSLSGVIMWSIAIIANPADLTYLISAIFTLYCAITRSTNWIKIYKEQQKTTNPTQQPLTVENEAV